MPDMDSIPAADFVRYHQQRDEEMMFLAERVCKRPASSPTPRAPRPMTGPRALAQSRRTELMCWV